MKKQRNHIEDDIQMAVVALARQMEWVYPEIVLLYYVQNGGKRSVQKAARAKNMGELPGVPDLVLPISDGVHSSLYIEMKKPKGRLSKSQKILHPILRQYGNKVVVCDNVEDAIDELTGYIKDRRANYER